MALVIADRVKDSTTTTGTGTVTLSGTAPTGFQNFSVIGNTNTTYYCIAHQTADEWEVGVGTYASSGTTLARTTVLSNSSATQPSALSFSAGTKDVFVTYPSAKSVNLDASGNATALGTPVSGTATNLTGTAASLTAGLATSLSGGSGGTVPYQSSAGVTAMLANGTAGQILQSNGTTLAPTWVAASSGGTVTSVTSANADATVATTTTTPVITLVQTPALRSATTTVNVSAATAPTSGQVLTATSGTAATWQTPSAGGSSGFETVFLLMGA